MRLSRKKFLRLNPCQRGIDWFDDALNGASHFVITKKTVRKAFFRIGLFQSAVSFFLTQKAIDKFYEYDHRCLDRVFARELTDAEHLRKLCDRLVKLYRKRKNRRKPDA